MRRFGAVGAVIAFSLACQPRSGVESDGRVVEQEPIDVVIGALVDSFHTADTARNAQGVIDLLWPEYSMLADGQWLEYEAVVAGSRSFMESLEVFSTEWTELRITRVGPDAAVSSFIFTDSILARDGTLTQSRGPTTLVWQRRGDEWRVLFGDADHYPLER